MLHGIDVAGNFANIFEQTGRSVVQFVAEEIRERGLSSLDLRGEDGFLADVSVKEKSGIGKQQGNSVETTEGGGSRVEQRAQFSIDFQSRNGRKWSRNKSPRGFTDGADGQIMAGGSPLHGSKLKFLTFLFDLSAEIERKLFIGKMKKRIFGDFFNLPSKTERNLSISGWASGPLSKEAFIHPVFRRDQQQACKQTPSRFFRG